MTDNPQGDYWTDDELAERLAKVRQTLLDFLHERTRLDWFKHKIRWRLSRQYIWPAAPESRRSMLDAAVEDDVGVEAFRQHLAMQQHTISDAIERYNHALRRYAEDRLGRPLKEFSDAELATLRRQRITFQGVRDELLWRARLVAADSTPEVLPELLSLRLAILVEEVRDQIFTEVATTVAAERADAADDMSQQERELVTTQIELRLRLLDRYHVAHLLAENYTEGRRFMRFDQLLDEYKELGKELSVTSGPNPILGAKIELYREIIKKSVTYLEEFFPNSAGTHDVVTKLLRQPAGGLD